MSFTHMYQPTDEPFERTNLQILASKNLLVSALSLAHQNPKTGLGMEKYHQVVTLSGCHETVSRAVPRPGPDIVRKT